METELNVYTPAGDLTAANASLALLTMLLITKPFGKPEETSDHDSWACPRHEAIKKNKPANEATIDNRLVRMLYG